MTPIYICAKFVLMLDSALCRLTRSELSDDEIRARVVRSAWMGRSWTFHEACLAGNLMIQLNDGFLRASEAPGIDLLREETHTTHKIRKASISELDSALSSNLEFARVGRLDTTVGRYKLPDGRREFLPALYQLRYAWSKLLSRSTTKPADVALILANLLGFALKDIINIPQAERVKAMLCALEIVPLDILFHDHPKTEAGSIGDRWIPELPAGSALTPFDYSDHARVVPGRGLMIPSDQKTLNFLLPECKSREGSFAIFLGRERWWVEIQGNVADNERLKQRLVLMISNSGYMRKSGALLSPLHLHTAPIEVTYETSVVATPLHFKPIPLTVGKAAVSPIALSSIEGDILILTGKPRNSSFELFSMLTDSPLPPDIKPQYTRLRRLPPNFSSVLENMQTNFRLARRLTIFMALVCAPCFLVSAVNDEGAGIWVKVFMSMLGLTAAVNLALLWRARVRDLKFQAYIKDLHDDQEIPETSLHTPWMYRTGLFVFAESIRLFTKLRRRLRMRNRPRETIEMTA